MPARWLDNGQYDSLLSKEHPAAKFIKENGIAPESKMVVLHDFTPCVDDELEVKRGQIVHVLYQENDWVYVISEESREGFIPHSYCAQYGSQMATLALNVRKKMPR